LNLLPLARDLHFHRLLAGAHLAGLLMAGIGIAALLSWAARQRRHFVPAVLGLLLLLVPATRSGRATWAAMAG
jgi:hypothetical protein